MIRRLALAILVMACAGGRPPPATDPGAELAVRYPYPTSSDPDASAALDREIAFDDVYDQAVAAYAARSYLIAARRFMAAARSILVPVTSFNGDIMARNRLACYTNAQGAWRRAGADAEARSALAAAAAHDPDNAQAIAALIAGLGSTSSSQAAVP
jgi:hypothetical protein